jgi:hypothetical protein
MYLLFHQILWNSTDKLFEVPKRKSQTNTDFVKTSTKASEETCMLQPQITLWNHNKHSCNSKELYHKPPHHNTNNQTKAQQATKRKLKPTCIHISHVPHIPQHTSRRKANNKLTTHQWEVKQHFEAFKLSGRFAKQKPNNKIHKYSLVKINHHYKPPNSKRHFQHPWTMGEPKDEIWSHTHTHTHMSKRKWQCA